MVGQREKPREEGMKMSKKTMLKMKTMVKRRRRKKNKPMKGNNPVSQWKLMKGTVSEEEDQKRKTAKQSLKRR